MPSLGKTRPYSDVLEFGLGLGLGGIVSGLCVHICPFNESGIALVVSGLTVLGCVAVLTIGKKEVKA